MTQHWVPPVGEVGAAPVATTPTSDWARLVDGIEPSRAARAVLLALVGGLAAQLLVVGQVGGINAVLWVALVLASAIAVRRPAARFDRLDLWLPLAALAFAAFVALRDEAMLFVFNLPMAGALTLASVVAIGGTPLTRRSTQFVARAGATALLIAGFGGGLLAPGVRPLAERLSPRASPRAVAALRGLLMALPLLLLFALLFAGADAVFATQVRRLVAVDLLPADIVGRFVIALVGGWLLAGTLVTTWLARRAPTVDTAGDTPAAASRIGTIEAIVVLVLLDGLFAAFAAIQAAYLFGGLDTLGAAGLTYADYARRGFFELVAVASIVGVVLLVVGRRVESSTAVRVAAIVLALLTGLVLVSAAMRLGLYQAAYGWTELRFYVLAAIFWLAICLAAAVAALALARTGWLIHAWLAAGLVVALAVNVVGPQEFATARNVERAVDPSLVATDGRTGLDVEYISWLGSDAVPVLVAARDRLPPDDARQVDAVLRSWGRSLRAQSAAIGWPSWNLARATALERLAAAGY